ncbi:sensor histidine kinase [Dyella sp. KRB-257]|uniref:sensor histidine kinase n=1 Tax=Dyella sp. KRB-257 TaxID=3400915 RepID=UPI003C0474A5
MSGTDCRPGRLEARFHALFRPHPESLLGQLRSPTYLRWQAGLQWFSFIAVIMLPLQKGFSWHWMGPTLLSLVLYLFFYIRMYIMPVRQMVANAAGLIAIGLLLWPLNSAAYIFLMIASINLALHPSWRVWLRTVAVASLLAVPVVLLIHAPKNLLLVVPLASLFGGFSNLIYMRGVRRDAELRLSQEEVRRLATLAERERIGRDLHDLLGHTLSLVALKSELARKLALRDPGLAQREMEEVERVARHALAEVRAAVTGMRRSDLAAELLSARLMLEASGIVFACDGCESLDLPHAIEAPLALVLREAVTNIHRHARATEARIDISSEQGELRMRISDNGCGGLAAHGNGVSGMRERVRALGGTLAIDSPPRKGTTITIAVPVAAPMPAAVGRDARPQPIGSAA